MTKVLRFFLFSVLCLAIFAMFSRTVSAADFTDVPKWHWAWRYIQGVSNAGIASGYPEGDYKPSLTVSRDQMAVFISRAVTGGDEYVPTGPATATFSDVPNTGYGQDGTEPYWAYKYIEFCASPAANIVRGYNDGSYHPTEVVNRGQMAVFIARSMVVPRGDAAINDPIPPPTFPDVTGDNEWAWCYKHVEFIAEAGVTQGYPDGNYQPGNQVSRDQMAVYICRAFDLPMPPQPYNVTDYFPLNQGDTWTYESDNGPYSSTISGTESISGQTCARMVSTYGGTNYWSTSEDGLRYGGWSSSGEGYNTYNPLLYIPNGIDPGYTDSQSLPAYHNGSLVGTANFTLTFIGVETVTVPAGTFLNCIKFEVLAQDAEGFTEHFHVWWAKGVGQVKQDQRPFGGSRWEELTSATVGGINYNGQSYNATDYFPMGQGDTWTYNTATGPETLTVSGTRVIGGETYVGILDTNGNTQYLRAGTGGVYWGGIETTAGLYTLVPPLLVPNGIIIGQTVNQSGSLYLNGVLQETGSLTLEFVRLEDVTVPAGTFTDCMVLHWNLTFSAIGDDVYLWVAKNVGIIKQDESPGWWSQLVSATVGGVHYGTSTYNITDFCPSGQGDTWTYNTKNGPETVTVSGSTMIGGQEYANMSDSFGNTNYQRNGSGGMYWGGVRRGSDLITFDPPILVPNNLIIGQHVDQNNTVYLNGVYQGTGTLQLDFIQIEDVTVPAGLFSGCMVLDWLMAYPLDLNDHVRVWFAPGVGLVKQDEAPLGGIWWSQLVSATVGGVHYP